MLQFEKDVINLLILNNIDHDFHLVSHLLVSDKLNIRFIPINGHPLQRIHQESTEKTFTVNLWEDIYLNHTSVVKSRILSLFGISERVYARSTKIKAISQPEINEFLRINHLNIITKTRYRYGMYHTGELIAVAAFGRSCPIQRNGKTYKSHELIRFCSLLNHTVVGGLSKFIHHFTDSVKPEHIMTSVDREWSTGKSYLKLGFSIDGYTKPQTFWISPEGSRYYAEAILKSYANEELKDQNWTPVENLGNIKLVKFI